MFLFKSLIVVCVLFGAVAALLVLTEKDARQSAWLRIQGFWILAMLAVVMMPVPYSLTMVAVGAALLSLTAQGVPLLAGYFGLIAFVPFFIHFAGLGPFTVVLVMSAPLVAGSVVLALRLAAQHRFVRGGIVPADIAVLVFIILYSLLLNRGNPITETLRDLASWTLLLGGGYLAASRSKLPANLFLLKSYALVGGGLALIAVFESLRLWPLFEPAVFAKGISTGGGYMVRSGLMRATGPFDHPITFSLFLASSFIAVWGLWVARYRRAVTGALAILIVLGLVGTLSRTGGLALVGGMATLMLIRRRFSELGLLVAVLLGGLFLNSLLPEEVRESSTGYRSLLFDTTIDIVRQNPILGDNKAIDGGKLEAARQGEGIVDMVNAYLDLALHGGMVLLLAFLMIPLCAWLAYWRIRKRYRSPEHLILAQVSISQLMGLLAGLLSASLTDKNLLYVLVFAGVVTGVSLNAARTSSSPAGQARRPEKDPLGIPRPPLPQAN